MILDLPIKQLLEPFIRNSIITLHSTPLCFQNSLGLVWSPCCVRGISLTSWNDRVTSILWICQMHIYAAQLLMYYPKGALLELDLVTEETTEVHSTNCRVHGTSLRPFVFCGMAHYHHEGSRYRIGNWKYKVGAIKECTWAAMSRRVWQENNSATPLHNHIQLEFLTLDGIQGSMLLIRNSDLYITAECWLQLYISVKLHPL